MVTPIRLLIAALLILGVRTFQNGPLRFTQSNGRQRLEAKRFDGPVTIDTIKADLLTYLELRKDAEPVILSKEEFNKPAAQNPLAFMQPSGWYRDEYTLDLKKRSNPNTPRTPHPLSFYELQKYGYDYLTEAILELGGPSVVAKAIGYEWSPPEIPKEQIDPSRIPVRTKDSALDIRGSLRLGNTLDENIDSASTIDMGKLKQDLEAKREQEEMYEEFMRMNPDGDFDAAMNNDYASARGKKGYIPYKAPVKIIRKSERWTLTGGQRAFLLGATASVSLAYGRASNELALQGSGIPKLDHIGINYAAIVDVFHALAPVVSAAAVASMAVCTTLAGAKNRSKALWAFKGLFGGPVAVMQLKGLGEVAPATGALTDPVTDASNEVTR